MKLMDIVFIVFAAILVTHVQASTNAIKPSVACGNRQIGRVIGGHNAGKWPLQLNNGKHWNHQCGGSLILDEWVVTAAHCVFKYPYANLYQVVLGDYTQSKKEPTEQVYNVTDIRIHYNFTAGVDIGNDIALLKLSRNVSYNKDVQPICLPNQDQRVSIGTKCHITGWGLTIGPPPRTRSTAYSDTLQEAALPIVSNSVCNASMSHVRNVDEKSMICAGYGKARNISGCRGDSGGPLSCLENGVYVLRGAVSWGDPYCRTSNNQHSVFARISTYFGWIQDQITSPPLKIPDNCKDNHWYCKQWKAKGLCRWTWYHAMFFKYCPISCAYPKCAKQTKKKHLQ